MPKTYRYYLDRGSRKFICPDCSKKTFVRYIDHHTGDYLSERFGRCDRENKCQYHLKPTKAAGNFKSLPEPVKILPVQYLPEKIMRASIARHQKADIFPFLVKLFGQEKASQLCLKYLVGASRLGHTVFWQQDSFGNVRQAKKIKYDSRTGKRNKDFPPCFLGKDILRNQNANFQQCFFGEHLLKDKSKKICIVESEKTALIASVYFSEYTWIATGGIFGCSWHNSTVLKNRIVRLYPDLGALDRWRTKSEELKKIAQVSVSMYLETIATEKQRMDGLDIADFLISEKQNEQDEQDEQR